MKKGNNATCQRMNDNRDAIMTLLDAERVQGLGAIPVDLMNALRTKAREATADSMIVINSAMDPLIRTALQLHYVDCLEWKEVAAAMGYEIYYSIKALSLRYLQRYDKAEK